MQTELIQNKIYEIRNQKVMLDFDLAELYGVKTKVLNQSVKRNIDRFPEDFMFQLHLNEWSHIRSHFVTAYPHPAAATPETAENQAININNQKRNVSALPYAFTEHGVTMLASTLKSQTAVNLSIEIVRAFIALKKFALQQNSVVDRLVQIEARLGEHDVQLSSIYDAIENLLDEKIEQKSWQDRERIGFKIKD